MRNRQTDRWRERESERQTDRLMERERKSMGGKGKCKKNARKSKTVHRIQMGSKFYRIAMAMNRVNLDRKRGIQIVHLRTDMILLGLEKGVRCYLKFQLRGPLYISPIYMHIKGRGVYKVPTLCLRCVNLSFKFSQVFNNAYLYHGTI